MFLLDDLLLAPIKGLHFIARQIQDMVDKEMNDETVIKQGLLELQMRRELGEVPDDEYAEREEELFARLRDIRAGKLEGLQQIHTAENSALIVETDVAGGDNRAPAERRV